MCVAIKKFTGCRCSQKQDENSMMSWSKSFIRTNTSKKIISATLSPL